MYYHDSIFTFLPVFTTLFALIQIVLYLIDSFALHRMAGNTGMKNPWIAWIPFAKDYLLGSLADRYNDTIREKKTRFHLWLTLLSAAQAPLAAVSIMVFGAVLFLIAYAPPTIMLLVLLAILFIAAVGLLYQVCYLITFYYVIMDFEPSRALLYTILAFFHLGGICLLISRNNVPVGIAGQCQTLQPKYNVR